MSHWLGIAVIVTVASAATAASPPQQALKAPASIHTEHEDIHASLVALTRVTGAVGTAAKELAAALHPHFVREEEIALPPLGLLAPLARGENPPGMAEAAKMADTLRAEMPRMLAEHQTIRAAVGKLRTIALQEKHADAQAFAAELALHAQTEEEVLYPAAILVGELIRARKRP
jgi:hypothetical protein